MNEGALAADIRTELHGVMVETMADEAAHHNWLYEAVRPERVPTIRRAYVPGIRVIGDCSKGVQYNCWWTPYCPDPMGRNWDPYGNSQTLCFHLHHLPSPADLLVGDIVTFGYSGEKHAAEVLETGADPWVWSFGHQGAPGKYRLSWDRRPQQWLRLPVAPTPMTPQQKLRAMTGWFSWVAWKLGEGAWAHYGKANATVRPNVPKRIPADWWKRYALFIANRNGGNQPKQGVQYA